MNRGTSVKTQGTSTFHSMNSAACRGGGMITCSYEGVKAVFRYSNSDEKIYICSHLKQTVVPAERGDSCTYLIIASRNHDEHEWYPTKCHYTPRWSHLYIYLYYYLIYLRPRETSERQGTQQLIIVTTSWWTYQVWCYTISLLRQYFYYFCAATAAVVELCCASHDATMIPNYFYFIMPTNYT